MGNHDIIYDNLDAAGNVYTEISTHFVTEALNTTNKNERTCDDSFVLMEQHKRSLRALRAVHIRRVADHRLRRRHVSDTCRNSIHFRRWFDYVC